MRYKFQSRQGKIEIEKTLFFCAHFSINPLNHVTFFTGIGTSALFFLGGETSHLSLQIRVLISGKASRFTHMSLAQLGYKPLYSNPPSRQTGY